MKYFLKLTFIPLLLTLSFSASAGPEQDVRDALQKEKLGPVRHVLAQTLRGARPASHVPYHWANTRSTVFEAPIGNYRLYAALPDGELPDNATQRSLITSTPSQDSNMLTAYALGGGKSLRFALIHEDQIRLMVQEAPADADKRFYMTYAHQQASAPLVQTSLLCSETLRARLQSAITGRDLDGLTELLGHIQHPDYVSAAKTVVRGVAKKALLTINRGLRKLGLSELEPAELPKYEVVGGDGKTYVARAFGESAADIRKLGDLIATHRAHGQDFVQLDGTTEGLRARSYLQKYATYFSPHPTAEFWVIEDVLRGCFVGYLSCSAHTAVMIHPHYRDSGLGQLLRNQILPHFKAQVENKHLTLTRKESPLTPKEYETALLTAENFEQFSQWAPLYYQFELTPYMGFEADIHERNIPSLMVFSREMHVQSFGDHTRDHFHFVFPKDAEKENAALRARVSTILSEAKDMRTRRVESPASSASSQDGAFDRVSFISDYSTFGNRNIAALISSLLLQMNGGFNLGDIGL